MPADLPPEVEALVREARKRAEQLRFHRNELASLLTRLADALAGLSTSSEDAARDELAALEDEIRQVSREHFNRFFPEEPLRSAVREMGYAHRRALEGATDAAE